jgi:hypothetical protein
MRIDVRLLNVILMSGLQAPSNHAAACLLTPRYVALRNRAMALS